MTDEHNLCRITEVVQAAEDALREIREGMDDKADITTAIGHLELARFYIRLASEPKENDHEPA